MLFPCVLFIGVSRGVCVRDALSICDSCLQYSVLHSRAIALRLTTRKEGEPCGLTRFRWGEIGPNVVVQPAKQSFYADTSCKAVHFIPRGGVEASRLTAIFLNVDAFDGLDC